MAIPSTDDQAATPSVGGGVAIQVQDVDKTFRIPTHRVDSFKERMVRPFAARDYRELRALDGISFDVRQGEFFGIVGRNGSGKSTLLKILASIYRADAGVIRMAGRLAPFIELGVGFNHDLTARENVVLNGVMMGLTPAETRRRLDAVLEFAELGEFVDLKLKNYSSGMLVRLAFSVMMEANADILLIDEVLAVGDAAFQQKCADAFHEMKRVGKTIVLVTHEMSTVEEYCHRAMLIGDGHILHIGDPTEIGHEYLRLNFAAGAEAAPGGSSQESGVRLLDAWLQDEDDERLTTLEEGQEIQLRTRLEILEDAPGIMVGFMIVDAEGIAVSEFVAIVGEDEEASPVVPGQRVEVRAKLENPLTPGRYFVHCGVSRTNGGHGVALYAHNAASFVVFGNDRSRGSVLLKHEIETLVTDGQAS